MWASRRLAKNFDTEKTRGDTEHTFFCHIRLVNVRGFNVLRMPLGNCQTHVVWDSKAEAKFRDTLMYKVGITVGQHIKNIISRMLIPMDTSTYWIHR